MQLPKGITGFWSGDTEQPPFLDEKAFRQLCHTLARETGGTVTEMDTAAGGNFYFAGIRRYDDTVFVLQNRHFPYAAFARRGPSGRMAFTEQPEWLRLPEGTVCFLSPAQLEQDYRGLCGALGPEEQAQLRYWKPQTVGEILFNTWD